MSSINSITSSASAQPELAPWVNAIGAALSQAQADFQRRQFEALEGVFDELPPGWAHEHNWLALEQATVSFALRPSAGGWKQRWRAAWDALKGKPPSLTPSWQMSHDDDQHALVFELHFGPQGVTKVTQTSVATGETHVLETA